MNTASSAANQRRLAEIRSEFDLATVRCSSEARLLSSIQSNSAFQKKLLQAAEGREAALVRSTLNLLKDAYRVDASLTPRLEVLRDGLGQVLRLVQPIEVYVNSSPELNAYCLPSRKGTRLVMCLNAGLFHMLTEEELMFVMGHEAGHAFFGHTRIPQVSFDHPEFSPFEVLQLRALSRRQEISCDRIGLLACQNVRAASSALFKILSGLPEKWQTFDETVFARHFEAIGNMAEAAGLEDCLGTHPVIPMRVNSLLAFSNSNLYAGAFNGSKAELTVEDLEKRTDYLLSVLDPDLSALANASEQCALNRSLIRGALMVVAADGVIEPAEVDFLKTRMELTQDMLQSLDQPDFFDRTFLELQADIELLNQKLSASDRAGVLRQLSLIAFCAGGLADSEHGVLARFADMLGVPPELFSRVVVSASNTAPEPAPKKPRRKRKTGADPSSGSGPTAQ